MEAIILIGGQCAGKTTWARRFMADHLEWVNIDVDDYKWTIPVYRPDNATWFHEESSRLAKVALVNALACGESFVYHHHHKAIAPPVEIEGVVEMIRRNYYKYDLSGRYFDTSLETAAERMLKRARRTPPLTFRQSFESSHRDYLKLLDLGVTVQQMEKGLG